MVLGAILIFGVFILPSIQKASDYSKNKIGENKTRIANSKEKQRIAINQNQLEKQYLEKKKTFKYLSDEHLLEMFQKQKDSLHPKILLALEEILVERKLINHSPTHEKMQKIEERFTNNNTKPYQKTSETEIENFATSLSFIIKNHNTSQKGKINAKATELSENIFYSSFRDIDRLPIALNTISNPLIDYKKTPNQAKYFAIWKTLKGTILELPNNPEIINENYDTRECVSLIKSLIRNSSENIVKIENGEI
jgi:hypothetical protein